MNTEQQDRVRVHSARQHSNDDDDDDKDDGDDFNCA